MTTNLPNAEPDTTPIFNAIRWERWNAEVDSDA